MKYNLNAEKYNEIYNNKLYDRLSELNKLFEELNKIKFNNNGILTIIYKVVLKE